MASAAVCDWFLWGGRTGSLCVLNTCAGVQNLRTMYAALLLTFY
jgi:hypothetical protein